MTRRTGSRSAAGVPPSRRRFLGTSAAALLGMQAPAFLLPARAGQPRSPNERLHVASIGVGGKGWSDLHGVASEDVVGICDVDRGSLEKAARAFPGAETYRDFRKLLERKDLDAVTVTTPDHVHAIASITAMRLGKHVYCQKPLTHSVWEARRMREVAHEMGVATQMGNQGHASNGSRQCVEWVRSGTIGAVREVHVWTDRPIWPQGGSRPGGTPPTPESLDWDLWIGPAPARPYHPAYHPFRWRGFWDFGTGALGDMACHNMDVAFWALELGAPTSVEAESSGVPADMAPSWSIIRYEFPARGDHPPVRLTWYDGGKLPPAELIGGEKPRTNGSILVGDKGTLYVAGEWRGGRLLPEERFREVQPPERTLPRVATGPGDVEAGHFREWIAACKGGPAALSCFDHAGPLTEAVLLGNVALRVGEKIRWNSAELRAEGCPRADAYLRREYRKGWEI